MDSLRLIWLQWLVSALKFAGLSAIFLGAHFFLIERTRIGEHFKQWESEILQMMVGSEDSSLLPIVINIFPVRAPYTTTDRALLDKLITELAQLKVRAIGVDVDFSPGDDGQPVTPDDWAYFNKWKALNNEEFKLYLGVHRRASDKLPASWLGRDEFKELAVGIARPADDSEHGFASIQPQNGLRQIVTVLYEDSENLTKRQLGRSLSSVRFRINYSDSMLTKLKKHTIDYENPKSPRSREKNGVDFGGKVVLIGDTRGLEDEFCRPFALAHAAALATLRQGGLEEIGEGRTLEWDAVQSFAGYLVGQDAGDIAVSYPRYLVSKGQRR